MKKLKECYNLYINECIDKDALKSLNEDICDIIVRHTSITQDMLDGWYKHKKDVFMSAQQALDYKLIDKIL